MASEIMQIEQTKNTVVELLYFKALALTYIYIYIYKERERERERYIYIYIDNIINK